MRLPTAPKGNETQPSHKYETNGTHCWKATKHQKWGRRNSADGFADLLTEDAALINIAGRRLRGRETIRETYHKALASPLAQVQTRLEIVEDWLLRPDVAVVNAIKHVTDERQDPAAPLPDRGNVTFVLVKEQEKWLIASVQTTPIK